LRKRLASWTACGCLAVIAASLAGCGDDNNTPRAYSQSVAIDEDGVMHGRLFALDIDSVALEYSLSGPAPQGELHIGPDGRYTFAPAENFNGQLSFSFVASDGKKQSAPATVSVTVNPVNDPPRADAQSVEIDEDGVLRGRLSALDPDDVSVEYSLAGPLPQGELHLDPGGSFTFAPAENFNGQLAFDFVASDGKRASAPAAVTVTVKPVNDPPRIRALDDLHNRGDVYALHVAIDPQDVDGDVTTFAAVARDPQIARMDFDAQTGILTLYPLAEGVAHFDVAAADGQYSDAASFSLTVGEVTHELTVERDAAQGEDVTLANTLDLPVRFRLDVNGALAPGSVEDIVDAIRAAPELTSGESMPLKIWHRMVDVTYRSYPLTANQWMHDPVIYLNSVGAGFCDDMASAYYQLATAAGYEGRVWTLGGHVVPELRIDGVWHMYDPDLGAYYVTPDGDIAGVELLAATPTLITAPVVDTLLPSRRAVAKPYDPEVAQIYATVQDNLAWDFYTVMPTVRRTMELNLPPGGAIAFPGPWEAAPRDINGVAMPNYANLMVTLPQGWLGVQRLPLILSAIRGAGRVAVGSQEFELGSAALAARLENRDVFIDEVTVLRSDTELQFVYLLNPATVSAAGRYDVKLQGTFIAGLQVQ
jgi:hypothetical protein